ncbi:alpha/beta-Hydrolase [Diplocarpon rosae]|nr:alpha/beta-Hydrolase [Diplocarpon rosae]
MAEPENATNAPESDAAENPADSIVPGDTPAQTGASMGGLGEHCVKDRPTPIGVGPSGEMTQLGGVDVYISKPADYPHAPSKLLLFLTGATGLHAENNQIQADKFAQEGFLVVLPDMFSDDPLPGSATYEEEKDPSIIEQIKMRAAETAKSFLIDMWLARQTPEKVLPIIHKVIEAAKDEFADAVANGADFEGTKSPLVFVCVENDQLFADEIREHGEKYLKENNIESEFKTYAGVPHGFGVVGEYEDAKIKAAQAEAFAQMSAWLKAH